MPPCTAARALTCLALLTAGLATVVAAAPGPRGRPAEGPGPDAAVAGGGLLVDVRLATAAQLPPLARASLIQEVNDIWRREGVRFRWPLESVTGDAPDFALRVLVVQRERGGGHGDHEWPVGELLLDQSDHPVAVASIDAAERILDTVTRRDEPALLHDRRLGIVLGRTVAHEIGHYLLSTSGHARRGLMRARIDASDFADLRSGAFFLDAPAGEWIRTAVVRTARAQARLARFVYAP